MIGTQRRLKSESSETSKKIPITSNDVIKSIEKKGEVVFYLPCYLRFLVKQIENVDAGGMSATLSGTLLFTFYYGNIDREIIDQFVNPDKSRAILLEFNQAESILLKQDKGITMKQDENQRLITFTIRQRFEVDVKGSVFLTPFQTLDMYLAVTIQSVHLTFPGEGKPKICFKFNCMTSTEVDVLGHGEQISFGYYRIASYYMDTQYTNSRKNPFKPIQFLTNKNESEQEDYQSSEKKISNPENQDSNQIRNYQYGHFRIPIYKYPGVSILTIFVPIWILGLIGLFVFFQEPGFGARLATIAVLALAYVAFIPTINESIPKTPEIKLVDLLILMQLTSTILLLVESFNIKQTDSSTFNFVWSDSVLFLIALALNAATFIIVLGLLAVHKCFWERKYQKVKIAMNKKHNKFTKKLWFNKECDLHFSKFAQTNKIANL